MSVPVHFGDPTPQQDAAIQQWLEDYITRPHEQLGRSGPVCPFVEPARRAGVVPVQRASWTAPHSLQPAGTGTDRQGQQVAVLVAVLRAALDRFTDHPWPSQVPRLHSLVVLLDQLREEQWPVLDAAHAAVKTEVMRRGLMLGQFHPACPAPAVHNPSFAVNVSPMPLVVIRRMAPHDVQFTSETDHFTAYQDHFRDLYEQHRAPAPLARLYEQLVADSHTAMP
ncbi:DUF6875 domain-containing protein [Streptomyces sp900116325]|uniref:DUF6875 domain-containing protein n=1 Tax=Streptomyces sp. 900116325 TaxID=3154295 RepID=UPI0033B31550